MSKSAALTVSFSQAVELLMLLSQTTKGKGLDVFRFLVPDNNSLLLGNNGSLITIYFLPDETNRYSKKDQKNLAITLEKWADENNKNLSRDLPNDLARSLSVEQFILYILFVFGSPLSNRIQDQVLVVTSFKDHDELTAMLQTITMNATFTRLAVSDNYAFFWVKDDESRGSSFQSMINGNYFTQSFVLMEYSDQYLRQLCTFERLKSRVNSAQTGNLLKYLG